MRFVNDHATVFGLKDSRNKRASEQRQWAAAGALSACGSICLSFLAACVWCTHLLELFPECGGNVIRHDDDAKVAPLHMFVIDIFRQLHERREEREKKHSTTQGEEQARDETERAQLDESLSAKAPQWCMLFRALTTASPSR